MIGKKIGLFIFLCSVATGAYGDFKRRLDQIAIVGMGVGVAALSAALFWEGVVQAQDLYQRSYVVDLQDSLKKIESRYSFLLRANLQDKKEVVDLFVVQNISFAGFCKKLAEDLDNLIYSYDLLKKVAKAWSQEPRNENLLATAEESIASAAWVIPRLSAWNSFLHKNSSFLALALFLRIEPIPQYSVYEVYPLIVYVEELDAQKEMLQDLYYKFLSSYDEFSLEDRTLLEYARDRMDYIKNEISRVIEGVGYH